MWVFNALLSAFFYIFWTTITATELKDRMNNRFALPILCVENLSVKLNLSATKFNYHGFFLYFGFQSKSIIGFPSFIISTCHWWDNICTKRPNILYTTSTYFHSKELQISNHTQRVQEYKK